MIDQQRLLAIIPARGGSERLPRKNILDLAGKPLIAWTIEAALNSKYIDRIVVSTDDQEIADISIKYGAEVPFLRPKSLATDDSPSIDTVINVLGEIEIIDQHYDYIVLLQPTSPLRTEIDIDKAIELLEKKSADSVISVCEVDHPPHWNNTLPDDGNMQLFFREDNANKRSQDFDIYYRLNGAIYIVKIGRLLKEESLFLKTNTFAYCMDAYSSVDIDKEEDLLVAKCFAKNFLTIKNSRSKQ